MRVWLSIVLLGGCMRGAAPAQPPVLTQAEQAKIANAIAVTVNETIPLLRDAEAQDGDDIIHTSGDEPTARMRLMELEVRWKPVWDAEKVLRVAQDGWATALEKGGDSAAAVKAVEGAFCKFAPLLPRTVPRLSLATYLCEVVNGTR